MTTETETAFNELLAEVQATHARMVEQLADDEATLLEAHKWVLSILQVAAEVNLWADTGPAPLRRDRRVRTRSGAATTADAFYCYAPIDPARTYRVKLEPGDAVYMSLTVYGGPDDGRYSTRIVGSVNSHEVGAGRRRRHPHRHLADRPGRARRRLDPPGARRRGRHHPGLPRRSADRDGGPPGTSRPTTRPRPTARTTPTWPGASGPPRPGCASRPASCPSRSARPTPSTRPTRCRPTTFGWAAGDAAYAMGAFELADDEALVIRGRSPECVFWNMCLWNRLLHTYNYDYERVTINGAQVQYESDGSWIIVVSARRPAHPNWVSTAGHRSGRIWFRWFLPAADTRAAPGRGPPGGHRMSGRPAPVRIDDLAEPRFSDEVRAILDFMEEAGSQLTLDPAELMATARAETGLDDFGPDDFVERLGVLCRAMREEGGFNGAGIMQQHVFILGLLKNRLLIEDLVRRHPEILDEQIVAPIIICGLPRTGTTHLHNLMSADPALRSLPYWESLEPVLAESRAARRPARPTRAWSAPTWRSRSSTRPCPTSTGCTR